MAPSSRSTPCAGRHQRHQLGTIAALDEFGDGISQKDLAASVGMEGSTLVRLLDTLEQKGQIERQADSHDRRAKRIYLTDAGREQVSALRAELLQIETEMLADVSDEQIDVMLEVLDGLITKFKH